MAIRSLARPMLGSIFIVGGAQALLRPEATAPAAEPVVDKALAVLPGQATQYLPRNPGIYVRATGAVQLLAGAALAVGKFPRASSLALASTVVPATLAGHPFWQESDLEARAQQKIHFWKNVSILGGLIIAGFDTEGRPGLSWRARRAAKGAVDAVTAALPGGQQPAAALSDRANELVGTAQELVETAGERLSETAAALGEKTAKLGKAARKKAPVVAEQALGRGADFVEAATRRADELVDLAAKQADELVDRASKQASDIAKATAKGRDQIEAFALGSLTEKKNPKRGKRVRFPEFGKFLQAVKS